MSSGLPHNALDALVTRALAEDGAFHDVTSAALIPPGQWGRGVFLAKAEGVVAGLGVAAAAMTAVDSEVSFDTFVADAGRVESGTELAEVEGPLAAILAAERVALNFLQRLSGIATLTRDFVDAVAGTNTRILDTRKTTPGLRMLERYAVRAGGGQNHRDGLAGGVLIKDNHIAAARARGAVHLGEVVREARAAAPHTMRIEIEVTTSDEADEAAEGGADIILLDNMSIAETHEAVRKIAGRALIEASGGVSFDNVRQIAEAGVDYISIGRLTHSAPALDISLEAGGV